MRSKEGKKAGCLRVEALFPMIFSRYEVPSVSTAFSFWNAWLD